MTPSSGLAFVVLPTVRHCGWHIMTQQHIENVRLWMARAIFESAERARVEAIVRGI